MLFVSRVVDQLQLQIALNTTHVTLTETLPKKMYYWSMFLAFEVIITCL